MREDEVQREWRVYFQELIGGIKDVEISLAGLKVGTLRNWFRERKTFRGGERSGNALKQWMG